MRFNTALIHGGFTSDKKTGATLVPIYQSTAFEHDTAEELEGIFKGNIEEDFSQSLGKI